MSRSSLEMLVSISASVTNRLRPRPSDMTTEGVGVPGRCKLEIASRAVADFAGFAFDASHINRRANPASIRKLAEMPAA